jgi:L-alanine-DL-glutamate epimerase-like enolase superfamily enzyme
MGELVIDGVDVVDCRDLVGPGDDGYLVAVHAGGVTGWYGPVRPAAAAMLHDHLIPLAIGCLVGDHTGLAARLRGQWDAPVGVDVSWAIGALDCAVWDLHGRAEGVSVAELLGAAGPPTVTRAYGSLLTLDIHDDANADTVADLADGGWWFTKWGLRASAGHDETADVRRLERAVRRVGELVGGPAAFDALWTWNPPRITRFGQLVGPDEIVWLEEPLTHHDTPWYAQVPALSPKLALGERVRHGDDPAALLGIGSLAAFTLDVVGCGGLTAAAHLTRQARAAGVPVYPHGRSLVPAVHLAAAFPDVVPAVEYQVQWQPHRDHLFHHPITAERGLLMAPQPLGLGPIPRRR